MKKILKIIIAQLLTLFFFLFIIAIAGQFYTRLHPSYEILSSFPDRQLGWKLVPNSLFTYTGSHWYENEFKTEIKINSLGFRDKERSIKKQEDLIRLVVIGDSSVAAFEVPFEKTPTQLLEKYLNEANTKKALQGKKYEVLNFGIGGFGLGQNLITNKIYVKQFSPEYVFLFIFEGDIWRTISPISAVTNKLPQEKRLHIRPVIKVEKNQLQSLFEILNFREFHEYLVKLKIEKLKFKKFNSISEKKYLNFMEEQRSLITDNKIIKISKILTEMKLSVLYPSNDFDKFVSLQNHAINTRFHGQRTRKREQKLFILELWSKLVLALNDLSRAFQPDIKMKDELELLLKIYGPTKPKDFGEHGLFAGSFDFPNFEKTVFTNLKVIQTMRDDIKSFGGNLVIVDATRHLIQKGRLPANLLSTILEKYCNVNKIGYVPLYKNLNKANLSGQKTRWSYDGHLNELGYQIFAESMYRWLQDNETDRSLNN
jgi:hypothetical protein